ncbi:MAG: UPF0164 family protein [Candidatus Latescibacterota bacterium]|nr:UPF0164 family protein [Candidatus Latescibacterota bacterium]
MRGYTNLILIFSTLFISFGVSAIHASSDFSGDFLNLGGGARGIALGNSFVAISDDATSTYWNPSGLTSVTNKQLHLMHSERFSGQVKHDFIAYAFPTSNRYQWGFGLLRVAVPDIAFTRLSDPGAGLSETNRPIVTSIETSADYAIYFSGAKRLREHWSVGTSIKIIYRTISTYQAHGIGLDIGSHFLLQPNLRIGLILRDATNTTIHWNTDADDKINPTLILGASYTIQPFGGRTIIAASTKGGRSANNNSNPFPFSASIEHTHNILALRFGHEDGQQNIGIGLQPYPSISMDVTYIQHEELDSTYQLSANISF